MPGVGLVLGAGGGAGRAFHAGVLAALQDTLDFDARQAQVIVGTSAGAVDAAFLRAGLSPHDLCARSSGRNGSPAAEALFAGLPEWAEPAEEGPISVWRPASHLRLAGVARRPWTVAPRSLGTIVAAMMPLGRRSTDLIERTCVGLHPNAWPHERLWVCAVRLDDGRRVVFGRDPDGPATVGQAVAASCAIPGYFAPVPICGQRYVDGGMHSPSNADVLAGFGLDLVIVSSPQTAMPGALPPSLDAAFRAACRLLLRREAALVRHLGSPVLILEPSREDVAVMGPVADSMSPPLDGAIVSRAYETTVHRLTSGRLAAAVEGAARRRAQAMRNRSAS